MVEETLNQLSDEIITLNQQQLVEGTKADGTKTRQYSMVTKSLKSMGGRFLTGDYISLLDTGAFWSSFFISATGGKLMFDATDSKTQMLVQEYGGQVFGLTDKSNITLAELARPIMYEKIINFLRQA